MLNDETLTRLLSLRGEEDNTLWAQGDLLRDNPLSASETKKIAELMQLKAATLNLRRRVSTETPNDKRNAKYAWSIYAIFVRIEDPIIRWNLMFSRHEWTVQSATEAVRSVNDQRSNVPVSVSKTMVVGDIIVKGRLEKDGTLIIKVFVGDDYECDTSRGSKYTTIEFGR